jgi:hypothetical protein
MFSQFIVSKKWGYNVLCVGVFIKIEDYGVCSSYMQVCLVFR